MYQEEIASTTADHLRTHIKDYLNAVSAKHSDKLSLVVPRSIDSASIVGGMISELPTKLPAYAIDCLNKSFAGTDENLFIYQYQGQINGMVAAASQDHVDKLTKRHSAAVEWFIREHLGLHALSGDGFTLLEFDYVETDFSGAELVDESADRELWLGAFSINVFWFTSEDGPNG